MNERLYCSFTMGTSLFGIPVAEVQEILRYQSMTPVPLAPPHVRGLINLRGQIVPALDLRRCLEMPALAGDAQPTNVILRTDEGAVSVLVDEIGDVLDVSDDAFEARPDTLRGAARDLVRGIYKLSQGLMMVLSTEATILASTASVGRELEGEPRRHEPTKDARAVNGHGGSRV